MRTEVFAIIDYFFSSKILEPFRNQHTYTKPIEGKDIKLLFNSYSKKVHWHWSVLQRDLYFEFAKKKKKKSKNSKMNNRFFISHQISDDHQLDSLFNHQLSFKSH